MNQDLANAHLEQILERSRDTMGLVLADETYPSKILNIVLRCMQNTIDDCQLAMEASVGRGNNLC